MTDHFAQRFFLFHMICNVSRKYHVKPPSTPPHPTSYNWVKAQRKLALTRAYMLLKREDGTVGRDDWVRLMACLRPDCDAAHVSGWMDGWMNAICSSRRYSAAVKRRLKHVAIASVERDDVFLMVSSWARPATGSTRDKKPEVTLVWWTTLAVNQVEFDLGEALETSSSRRVSFQ